MFNNCYKLGARWPKIQFAQFLKFVKMARFWIFCHVERNANGHVVEITLLGFASGKVYRGKVFASSYFVIPDNDSRQVTPNGMFRIYYTT